MATPVINKVAFKDEGKDVLADVLRDPNRQAISGDTGTFFEPAREEAVPPAEAPPEPAKSAEPPAPAVSTSTAPPPAAVPEVPAAPEKLYAGKFKSEADLEKAYTELERSFTKKSEEAATLRKNAATAVAEMPPAPAGETPEARLERINRMLDNPDAYFKEVYETNRKAEEVQRAERAQVDARMNAWRETNKDLAKTVAMPDGTQVPLEQFVGTMVANLTSADPSLDPWAALEKATTHMRFMVGAIRDDGKKEALTVQSEATPLAAKVNTPPPTEQPQQAPVTAEAAYDAHLAELRANAARVRRAVR